ncbi:MBL fold metallo-hydrolase [Arthrobacter livingstonensis]|uniref:MBL fold metallo-hydrolase n=1 Tax=Arthrobacter livingstonensis TaxID=670078 RepID=UPI001FE3D29C|nr:MBL fold metallo-hydrolase [Arthrobacter livingstonensis]
MAGAPVTPNLDVNWIHGSRSRNAAAEPLIQVHRHDEHSFIPRQSKASSYEAPFLYLLFGNSRALLLDTGATADPTRFPLRATVDSIVVQWLAAHPRAGYGLVVAHTHGHGDHIAGDGQFAGRPDTEVVGAAAAAVCGWFGFTGDCVPVNVDLGGRVLDVIPTPGHQEAAVTIFDPWTGWLLTGDTVYRGRLYVEDMAAFSASLDLMVDLARTRPVTSVMGCHIEMTNRAGHDYPLGTLFHPDEPPLQMSLRQLAGVREAAHAVAARPGGHRFDDFIIFNGPCRAAFIRQRLRRLGNRLRAR